MKHSNRYYLLDLIRTLAVLLIVTYHCHETIFHTVDFYHSIDESIYGLILPIARFFSPSGIVAITLSAFLIGLTRKPLPWRIVLYALIGMIIVGFTQAGTFTTKFFWEWDVYQYIFLSFISLAPISRSRKLIMITFVLGVIMMSFNWWTHEWPNQLPLIAKHILIGVCDHLRAGWPLLPWLGLVWIYYGVGYYTSENLLPKLRQWQKIEWVIWTPIGLWCLQYIGAYFPVKLDAEFYCFIFRQGMDVFWGNWFWLTLFIRLAFLEGLNNYLAKIGWVRWLSRLHWNIHFGRVYLIQFFWLALGGMGSSYIEEYPRFFDVYFTMVLVMSELSSRLISRYTKK